MPQESLGTESGVLGLTQACDALAAGRVVAVPNPLPMTYGLVATTAAAVNAIKSRPRHQPVGAAMHDRTERQRLVPSLDLPPAGLGAVEALLDQRVGILLPLRREMSIPGWIAPAVGGGRIAIFNPRWDPTGVLWDSFPRLFGSSANRTGQAPAGSAAEVRAIFGDDCPVIDGDALRDGTPLAPTTMVRLDRRGRLSLARSGAQDQAYALASQTSQEYLEWLAGLVGLSVGPPQD